MHSARIKVEGRISLPIEIRNRLGLKDGDIVVFFEKDGDIIVKNSMNLANDDFLPIISEAMLTGNNSERDVDKTIKQIRKEVREELLEERRQDNL